MFGLEVVSLVTSLIAVILLLVGISLWRRRDATFFTGKEKGLLTFQEIDRELNATLDPGQVLDLVLDRAMTQTAADRGLIAFFDEHKGSYFLVTERNYPPGVDRYRQEPWPAERGIVGRVARTGQAALVSDVSRDGDYASVSPDTRSELAVPFLRQGQVIGVINLESDRLAAFNQGHQGFLQRLCDHAAVALTNAHLYQQEARQARLLQQKANQLAEILKVGNALKANLSLPDVLEQITRAVTSSLGFNLALLSLVDEDDPTVLKRVAGAGLDPATFEQLRATSVPLSQYQRIMQERFRISQSYYVSHSHPEIWEGVSGVFVPDLGERREGEWQSNDALFVPLMGTDGRIIGILSVDDPVDRMVPTLETIEGLEVFANQAAIAIENAKLYEQARRLAITDGLTGLFNSRYFYEALEKEMQKTDRYGHPLSLIILDLDDFKAYNDAYGHLVGDNLLVQLASLLTSITRGADIVARYGGEEFAIIVPETSLEQARQLAERIRVAVENHVFMVSGRPLETAITVSVGVAAYPQGSWGEKQFVQAADAAAYAAKQAGKNRVCIYGRDALHPALQL
ncbi:MAG: diguanylate cyclase [Chloroflexota bacterium]